MRDKNRIPKILNELERIWASNPDFRLGQLIVVGTRPKKTCPEVFSIEDEQLLEGLKRFENKTLSDEDDNIPDWKKYPNVTRVELNELTLDLLIQLVKKIKLEKCKMVVTPIELMRLNGAPVADQNWLLKEKARTKKLKNLLLELSELGILKVRNSKQDYKGIKEAGYDII